MKIALVFIFFALVLLVLAANIAKGRQLHKLAEFGKGKEERLDRRLIEEVDLVACPDVVARYLRRTGVLGKKRIRVAQIIHSGKIRLNVDDKWRSIGGEYRFLPTSLAFKWLGFFEFFPGLEMAILDSFNHGLGTSSVFFNSLIKIDQSDGEFMDASSLGRLLSEMVHNLSPVTSSAQDDSISELLRFL